MPNKIKILLITLCITITVLFVSFFSGHLIFNDFQQLKRSFNTAIFPTEQRSSPPIKKSVNQLENIKSVNEISITPKKESVIATCTRPPLIDTRLPHAMTQKHYQLETNLGHGYEDFLSEFQGKLNKAFQHIEHNLGLTLRYGTQLNLVYQTTEEDFNNAITMQNRVPSGYQGVYLFPEHLSLVYLQNHKQGIKTSIHEAMHAFNQSYWGNSLRFFNEGMAEYYANITIDGVIPPFDFTWIQHQQYPKQVSTLLFTNTDWHGDTRYEQYQNSKALFYFLMSRVQGKKVIVEIMKKEMEDPCHALPNSTIEALLFELYPNHQQAFDYWFRDGLSAFLNQN